MSEKLYEVPAEWQRRAFVSEADYQRMYQRSIADPDGFWAQEAKRIHWFRPPARMAFSTFCRMNSMSPALRAP